MRLIINTIILLLIFSPLNGCASNDKTEKKSNDSGKDPVEITLNDLYIWANLMPGGEPKFHLTGSLKLSGDKNILNDKKLKEIEIFQKEVRIYNFTPDVEYSETESGTDCEFRIDGGLSISDRLDLNKEIDVIFIIGNDLKEYTIESNNQSIEKAY
jgi:hypothetical protein